MGHVSYWSQTELNFNLGVVLWFLGAHDEEGCGALGVTYVVDLLLTRSFQDIVNHSWKIVDSYFVPAEVPESCISWSELRVFFRIGVSSGITHPNVISIISQNIT